MGKQSSKLKPQTIADLRKQTDFTEKEIQQWYQDFIKDWPKGYLTLDEFEKMYIGFFPKGDASKFARHVFRAFDVNDDGHVDFREFICGFSATLRGTVEQKLKWAFKIYDADKNGFISKSEMKDIISAIHRIAGTMTDTGNEQSIQQKIEQVFQQMDKNHDEQISLDEFLESASKDISLVTVLELDHDI
ncbi:neurocalcin homolog [Saccostrea echinata]|uniref:neurocalcin homolog n=1 Tax=Saccostrea echinata TaxID=191078 RepID=UPI002A840D5F|nr:neurocalcin homolog [Saccostrea echinata]